jgi:deoxycytidine triphosphate deaminase
MTGQILNNKQIDDLVKQGVIVVTPNYDSAKLQIAQYPLSPLTIWQIDSNHKVKEVFRFDDKNTTFNLKPKTYYLVDTFENIKLPQGIVGRFIPSSNLIELGLTLTSGKIEFPYGQNNEKIRFGIFNCLDIETTIDRQNRIAYIQFFDLRGQENLEYKLTAYDKDIYNDRIYHDGDGPNYERDNHE